MTVPSATPGPLRVQGGRRPAPGSRERGSASILALGVGLALLSAGLGLQTVGAATVARHRAGSAADLGALSGALHANEGVAAACARVASLVAANGAELVDCTVVGTDVTVTVAVVPTGPAAEVGRATARARAGPVITPP